MMSVTPIRSVKGHSLCGSGKIAKQERQCLSCFLLFSQIAACLVLVQTTIKSLMPGIFL